MSSISIAPVGFEINAPKVRLTRRGRFVVFLAFLAMAGAVMLSLGGLADAGAPQQIRYIDVVPGQTLTEIAQQVGGDRDIRDTILEIEKLNGMDGAALQIGQHLAVPVR